MLLYYSTQQFSFFFLFFLSRRRLTFNFIYDVVKSVHTMVIGSVNITVLREYERALQEESILH